MAAPTKEIILTPEGKIRLEEELHYLETEKRSEVSERIRIAREFGDISENSEYDDAKNEQAAVEGRINEIITQLANATIVEDAPKRSTKVSIGSTVTVADQTGTEHVLQIVGTTEANPEEGRISNESPAGAALLGHKKDDLVVFDGPTGRKIEFKVVKIASR